MKIGFDFDGTIIDHNKTKVKMCLERGKKIELREANSNIFEKAVGKDLYKEISQSLYREETANSDVFPEALEVMKFLKSSGHEIFIVSARRSDSRVCAVDKLRNEGFLPVITEDHIHFCKESEKSAILADLGIDLYVDDKLSVLQTLPPHMIKVLFDDQSLFRIGKIVLPDTILVANNWEEVRKKIVLAS